MQLSLPPDIVKLIEKRVREGKYRTPEDVVAAALSNLEQQEAGDFHTGELDRLIAEGERSGAPLDGGEVFDELRALRKQNKAG